MALPELPRALRAGIDELVARHDRGRLEAAALRLSAAYRSGGGARAARSGEDVVAYAAYRAPATYASCVAVLGEVARLRPGWQPRSVLDVGAGPGIATWAALAVWPGIERLRLVEAEAEMIRVGRALARAAGPVFETADWVIGDIAVQAGSFDLVLASYVLNEVEDERLADVVSTLWARAADTLVIVEPGTPAGYARALAARSTIVAERGFTLAPCPHDALCPLDPPDWCHFAVRLQRGEAHRAVKAVSRGFEDEKYSYAALTRAPHRRVAARIIRQPQIRSGHVLLTLSEPDGIRHAIVSRRDRDAYRRARKAGWGDALELGGDDAPG